jgi:hypothetical protein
LEKEKKIEEDMIRNTQNQTYEKLTTVSMSTLNHNFTKLKEKEKEILLPSCAF